MMVKIEEETREADAKKLVVQADEKEADKAAAVAQGIKVRTAGGVGVTRVPLLSPEGLAPLCRCLPFLQVRAGRPPFQSCKAAGRKHTDAERHVVIFFNLGIMTNF